jgi:hypothetical protein
MWLEPLKRSRTMPLSLNALHQLRWGCGGTTELMRLEATCKKRDGKGLHAAARPWLDPQPDASFAISTTLPTSLLLHI